MSIVLKEDEIIDNGQICLMENKKSIPCKNKNEENNLKLHVDYQNLKKFYEYNCDNIKKVLQK